MYLEIVHTSVERLADYSRPVSGPFLSVGSSGAIPASRQPQPTSTPPPHRCATSGVSHAFRVIPSPISRFRIGSRVTRVSASAARSNRLSDRALTRPASTARRSAMHVLGALIHVTLAPGSRAPNRRKPHRLRKCWRPPRLAATGRSIIAAGAAPPFRAPFGEQTRPRPRHAAATLGQQFAPLLPSVKYSPPTPSR